MECEMEYEMECEMECALECALSWNVRDCGTRDNEHVTISEAQFVCRNHHRGIVCGDHQVHYVPR